MKPQEIKANYANIQKRKEEIKDQLQTLLPKEFHNPQRNIQEAVAQFGAQAKKKMLDGYLEAALWAEGDDGEFDEKSITDIAPESLTKAKADIDKFLEIAGDEVYEARWGEFLSGEGSLTPEQIGHDLLLTRNGHGAGFWDRNLGELGDELTAAAQKMGEVMVYMGDDGMIYMDGGLDESGFGAVANWAGKSLGKWGKDKFNRLSQAGQKAIDGISNTAQTAQKKYQAGQRAANVAKIRQQRDAQDAANKEKLIQIKQRIDQLGKQYKQLTGKSYKIGGAIHNPIPVRAEAVALSLDEAVDDYLDALNARPEEMQDMDWEEFDSIWQTAEQEPEDSDEMNMAKRNHLARLMKMKADKLSELEDLEELNMGTLSRDHGANPKFDDLKGKMIDRFMGQEHPTLTAGGDYLYKVRIDEPMYYTRNYMLGKMDKTVPSAKGGFENVEVPTGKITFRFTVEYVSFRKDRDVRDDVSSAEVNVTFDTRNGKKLVEFRLNNAGRLHPERRRDAVLFINGVKKALEQPFKEFGADISSGKEGGFSEENRKILQTAKKMVADLKPNDFYTQMNRVER